MPCPCVQGRSDCQAEPDQETRYTWKSRHKSPHTCGPGLPHSQHNSKRGVLLPACLPFWHVQQNHVSGFLSSAEAVPSPHDIDLPEREFHHTSVFEFEKGSFSSRPPCT